jgi:hypothetical protein
MNTALDQVHAGDARQLARDGYGPVLKKTRWCVLKRKTNLTRQQRFRLRDLLRYNLRTARAYLLKEAFQQFWEYESPSGAGKFLDVWCCQVMRSRIEPMKKITRTLRSRRALILKFSAPGSSSPAAWSRASTTRPNWPCENPTASAPPTSRKPHCTLHLGSCLRLTSRTDFSDEAILLCPRENEGMSEVLGYTQKVWTIPQVNVTLPQREPSRKAFSQHSSSGLPRLACLARGSRQLLGTPSRRCDGARWTPASASPITLPRPVPPLD